MATNFWDPSHGESMTEQIVGNNMEIEIPNNTIIEVRKVQIRLKETALTRPIVR